MLAPGASKIAYDESVRALTAQAGVLDNLRSRAAILVSVATLVTSVLGGQVLAKPSLSQSGKVVDRLGNAGWIGVGAMLSAVACAILILWPYRWRFDQSGKRLLEEMDVHNSSVDDSYRILARRHDDNHTKNGVKLRRLFWTLQAACVALSVETVAWLWDLRG